MDFKKIGIMAVLFLSGCAVVPEPIGQPELYEFIKKDSDLLYESQEPLNQTLTIDMAMARALKYNLENRVKLMEQSIANKSLDLAKLDMLPSLGLSVGYYNRNKYNASESMSVLDGTQSLEPSTSQERKHTVGDIRLVWNILDFGVSYMQAKQDADLYLISKKTRQNAMLNLLHQVRKAYWQAAAMQKLSTNVDLILARVDKSLDQLTTIRKETLSSPLSTLQDIRALIETKQQLEKIKEAISFSHIELATLINSPPTSQFKLNIDDSFPELPQITQDIDMLELTALMNSSLYINEIYNARIEQLESRKALMRILPGIEFSYGGYYDSNSFLWQNQWREAGVRVSGDLIRAFAYDDLKEYSKISEQITTSRRMAMNMAVVAKVHLAWQAYNNSLNRLQQADYMSEIDQQISSLTKTAQINDAASGVEVIQNEFRAFRSMMSNSLAYAESQDAFGAFVVSLGISAVPMDYQSLSVDELAAAVGQEFKLLESGNIPMKSAEKLEVEAMVESETIQ
jgi:outer membrane protein TolC